MRELGRRVDMSLLHHDYELICHEDQNKCNEQDGQHPTCDSRVVVLISEGQHLFVREKIAFQQQLSDCFETAHVESLL